MEKEGPLEVPPEIEAMLDRQWQGLARAGTWLRDSERISVARVVRDARAGRESDSRGLSATAVEAARKIAVDAHHITGEWVTGCHERGLDELPMLELTSVVARVAAMDTFATGIGAELTPLPEAAGGEPTRETVKGAKKTKGWQPTRGVAGAPNAFSAVAAEHEALHDLHSAFYLSLEEMGQMEIDKGLDRGQMELLASKTSDYNDCMY